MAEYFKYKTAIVRGVASSLPAEAQRQDNSSPPVDWDKAVQQHRSYVNILRDEVGLKVIELPANDTQPDCVFVEDVAVAIGNKALITTPGHVTRRDETLPVAKCLEELGMELTYVADKDPEALMDGGDVLFTGEEIFVGISDRTNKAGCDVLARTFSSFPVTQIPVGGALHLKSGCSLAKPGIILQAIGTPQLQDMAQKFQVLAKKSYTYFQTEGPNAGSNCLYIESPKIGPTVIHQPFEVYPHSKKAYGCLSGVTRIPGDISEFDKVDGALTCCSVLLNV